MSNIARSPPPGSYGRPQLSLSYSLVQFLRPNRDCAWPPNLPRVSPGDIENFTCLDPSNVGIGISANSVTGRSSRLRATDRGHWVTCLGGEAGRRRPGTAPLAASSDLLQAVAPHLGQQIAIAGQRGGE